MCLFFLLVLSSLHSGLFHILYFFNKVLQNMSQLYWQKYYTNSCKKKKNVLCAERLWRLQDQQQALILLFRYFDIRFHKTRQVSSSQNWLRKSLCYLGRLSGDDRYYCESLPNTHWAGKRCSGPQSPGVRNQVIQAIVGFFLMCINAISLY